MFCALKTRLQALFYKVFLQFFVLSANITKTQLLAFVTARSTTFGVYLSYNVALSLTVKCNCSN